MGRCALLLQSERGPRGLCGSCRNRFVTGHRGTGNTYRGTAWWVTPSPRFARLGCARQKRGFRAKLPLPLRQNQEGLGEESFPFRAGEPELWLACETRPHRPRPQSYARTLDAYGFAPGRRFGGACSSNLVFRLSCDHWLSGAPFLSDHQGSACHRLTAGSAGLPLKQQTIEL